MKPYILYVGVDVITLSVFKVAVMVLMAVGRMSVGCSVCCGQLSSFPRSWLVVVFLTRVTRKVTLVEHELVTLPLHISSSLFYSKLMFVLINLLVFCVEYCWPLFVFLPFFSWVSNVPSAQSHRVAQSVPRYGSIFILYALCVKSCLIKNLSDR